MAEKHFQEEVNRWGQTAPGVYTRLHDHPTKSQQAKPWDCQWLAPDGTLHALELKYCWGDESLRFDCLETQQRDALLRVEENGGAGWLVVLWRGQARPGYCKRHGLPRDYSIERCYAIPIRAAVLYQRAAEVGSWSIEWANSVGVNVLALSDRIGDGRTTAWEMSYLAGDDALRQRDRWACEWHRSGKAVA